MATVDGLTKARMLAIESESITAARIDPVTSHLIFTTHGGTDIDVGDVHGPPGPINPNGADLTLATLQTFAGPLRTPSVESDFIGTLGRYVGSTVGAPVGGTFLTNDFASDATNGSMWVCTAGGSPGTWVALGGPKQKNLYTTSVSAVTASTLVNNTYSTLTFDSVFSDPKAAWNGTNTWTCKLAGLYAVSATSALSVACNSAQLCMNVNGVAKRYGNVSSHTAGGSSNNTPSIYTLWTFALNATMTIGFKQDSGANASNVADDPHTYLDVIRLGN